MTATLNINITMKATTFSFLNDLFSGLTTTGYWGPQREFIEIVGLDAIPVVTI